MPDVGLRKRVEAVPGNPSPHGLLGGCIPVVDPDDPHELNGTDVPTAACTGTGAWQDCPADPEDGGFVNPPFKEFDRLDFISFEPVTVYKGITCSTFGMSFEEGQTYALEQLRLGEQVTLETFFMSRWLCTNAAANDLTPMSGPLSVVQGVGALENWLAVNYSGTGVIHAPAGVGAMFSRDRVVPCCTDGCPTTLMGNSVVLGAGYSANLGGATCVVAAPGTAWLYITPAMRIRRDPPHLVLNAESQAVDYVRNDRYALAEATSVIEVACDAAAMVLVTLC